MRTIPGRMKPATMQLKITRRARTTGPPRHTKAARGSGGDSKAQRKGAGRPLQPGYEVGFSWRYRSTSSYVVKHF